MNTFLYDNYGIHLILNGKEIGIRDNSNDFDFSKKEIPTNCVNCGAILTGNKCEYCGTKY